MLLYCGSASAHRMLSVWRWQASLGDRLVRLSGGNQLKKKAHNNSSNSVTMLLRVFSFSVLIYKDGSLIFTCQLQLWNIKKENARTAGTVSVMLHLLLQ